MSAAKQITPSEKAINAYYEALQAYQRQDVEHETATSTAFPTLLEQVRPRFGWTLIPQPADTAGGRAVPPHGTFRDEYSVAAFNWTMVNVTTPKGTNDQRTLPSTSFP
jgi:hypothetical protein